MAYLFWKDGRLECPPCPACGSGFTTEYQEIVRSHAESPKVRVIWLECRKCEHRKRMGTFRHLGGHSFEKIGT